MYTIYIAFQACLSHSTTTFKPYLRNAALQNAMLHPNVLFENINPYYGSALERESDIKR